MSEKVAKNAAESAIALIKAIDAHEAAIKMAESLKLNAEVTTVVGKWDERGQITGWTKKGKSGGRANTQVEVFISDLDGADREFRRYARKMEELLAKIEDLEALNAGYKSALDASEAVRA